MLTKRTYSVLVLLVAAALPVGAAAASTGADGSTARIGVAPAMPAAAATPPAAVLTQPAASLHRAIRVSLRRMRTARRARLERLRQHRESFAALPGGVSRATLDAIAACESGGNPAAVSAGGTYRGKYQFDQGTWESVGGHGDPAAAPEAEQDYRAALLYSRAGSSPWPICG
ncbi:MAG TPA: transglycosylase family protein [Solirubrobacterales bacterium]|nr:transglycosylase family protein [Solirubrobacterales bacterium]